MKYLRINSVIGNLFYSLIICLASISTVYAYDYHVGVPEPWVNPDVETPAIPSNWTNEIPGYYYISNSNGSDSMTYGTPSSPKKTIPEPVPAGSLVVVDGEYNYKTTDVIHIWGNGTSGNWVPNTSGPVWIIGANSNQRAEFTTYKMVVSGSYIYFDNVFLHSGSRFQIGSYSSNDGGDHIMLRNSEVEGLPTDGAGSIVSTVSSQGDPVEQVLYYNCEFHSTGNLSVSTDVDAGIVTVASYTSHAWILNNTMHTSSGSAVQINAGGNSASTHHIYVSQNHIYNSRQSGIWVKYATDVIFSENVVHDIITTSWSPSKGMGAQYEPQRLWMINNIVYNVEYGIRVASTNSGTDWNIYMIGNLIYDAHAPGSYGGGSWDEACIHLHGGVNRYILNNTLVNCDAGINMSSTVGSYYIENNIISNVTTDSGHHIFLEYQKNTTTVDNNIFYQNGSNARIQWGSSSYNLATFKSTTGQCSNCLLTNPQFVSTASKDYNVVSGSPTLDKGSLDSVFETFTNLYGLSINKDINKLNRIEGASIDIGAYEQQTGQIITYPPSPPILNAE